MKFSRNACTPIFVLVMGIGIACSPALRAQMDVSNECCLKIELTNDVAFVTIESPAPLTNNVTDVFFKTNLTDSSNWTWLFRCAPGQTNLVISNLPPDQGYFMLGVTNAIRPGFDAFSLPPEDDSPSTFTALPLTLNFYGAYYTNIWVNNNGNVTFDNPQSAYTPSSLTSLGVRIIAPYWADVDTQNPISDVVKYGTNVVDGHAAFGVDWVNVGYYASHADKLLSCQLVIIDRSDIVPGDFDMEFNYFKVQWEWGDVSKNNPPHAGFSSGMGGIELPGSGVEGAFMDTNAVTGLIYQNPQSVVPGRFFFLFRDGQPVP